MTASSQPAATLFQGWGAVFTLLTSKLPEAGTRFPSEVMQQMVTQDNSTHVRKIMENTTVTGRSTAAGADTRRSTRQGTISASTI